MLSMLHRKIVSTSECKPMTQALLQRSAMLMEVSKQPQYATRPMEKKIIIYRQ